jgi:hypothetical protein
MYTQREEVMQEEDEGQKKNTRKQSKSQYRLAFK